MSAFDIKLAILSQLSLHGTRHFCVDHILHVFFSLVWTTQCKPNNECSCNIITYFKTFGQYIMNVTKYTGNQSQGCQSTYYFRLFFFIDKTFGILHLK